MSNNNNARYQESVKLREKDPNANNKICFEVRATALHPRLNTEEFPLCSPRTFHKGTSTEELRIQAGSTRFLTLSQSSTQEVGTKPSTKQRDITTW